MLGSLALMSAGALYFICFGSSMAFLRGATFRLNAAPERYALRDDPAPTDAPLTVVTSIPTPPMDVPWWSPVAIVNPNTLERYTLVHGAGNCAAKSRGLGWWLHARGVPFRLVHLLLDPKIRDGEGHVMVETTWLQDGTPVRALLDPLAAGVPVSDGVPLTSERLISDRQALRVSYEPIRPDMQDMRASVAVPAQFPEKASDTFFVGFSSDRQVISHLQFMERLSSVLPDSLISRYVGMSASLFLGIYPSVFVPPSESERLSDILRLDMLVAQVVVWSARAAFGLGIIVIAGRIISAPSGTRASRESSPALPLA